MEISAVDYHAHEQFLEHYGVKGMKWGVRRDRRVNRLASVGRGEGGVASKARAAANVSLVDVARGRGLRGGAARRAERQRARNQRIRTGQSTVRDKLTYVGGTRPSDLVPVRTKNASTSSRTARKSSSKRGRRKSSAGDIAIVTALGTATAANIMFNVAARKLG